MQELRNQNFPNNRVSWLLANIRQAHSAINASPIAYSPKDKCLADDSKQAWLIKNSWGTDWGENGYMWIRYGSNQIGDGAAWVDAREYVPLRLY